MSTSLFYRNYIQGLRGVAVLSVLIYHIRPNALSGGFVGVDIFFVISGFLLTRILIQDIETGKLSFVEFYARRARRILPAFIVVSVAILLCSIFLLLPPELINVAKSLEASALFVPNIYFYATSDYFGPAAGVLPALHFWSLGVEEQYYILLPFILSIGLRFSRILLATALVMLLLVSLVTSQLMVLHSPPAAFYLLPSRAFELLIGSVIACLNVYMSKASVLRTPTAALGLALLIAALFLLNAESRFPGLNALIPTVGVAFILWSGDRDGSFVTSLLDFGPLTYVGNISYSLYLIHWPVIVFFDRVFPTSGPYARPLWISVLSVGLAALSYRFVEQAFRNKSLAPSRPGLFMWSGVSLAVLVSASLLVVHLDGFSSRLGPLVNDVLAYRSTVFRPYFRSGTCFLDPEQHGADLNVAECLPRGSQKSVILWGDSAGASLSFGLQQSLARAGYSFGQITSSACAPGLGLAVAARPNCVDVNNTAAKLILDRKPDVVLLAANWPPREDLLEGLDRSIEMLTSSHIPVIFIGTPLQYKAGVPQIVADRLLSGRADMLSGSDLIAAYINDRDKLISSHFAHNAMVKFVSVIKTICVQDQCPLMVDFKVPLEFDSEHLTQPGSVYVASRLVPKILSALSEINAGR